MASTPSSTTPLPSTSKKGILGKLADPHPHVPNAERNAAQCVSFADVSELTAEEVDYTIAKLKEWDAQFGW